MLYCLRGKNNGAMMLCVHVRFTKSPTLSAPAVVDLPLLANNSLPYKVRLSAVSLNAVNQNAVNLKAVNLNAVNLNAVNLKAVDLNAVVVKNT